MVLPYRVGDGDFYPDLAKDIQRADLSQFVGIPPHTEFGTGEQLHTELVKIAKLIADLIPRVPDYDKSFMKLAYTPLLHKLKANRVKPQTVPRNLSHKPKRAKRKNKSFTPSLRRISDR